MLGSNSGLASSSETDSASWSFEDDVEVHAENTGEGVVLNTQIDVLLNTESETAGVGEVDFSELSVLDLEASFEDLVSLVASNGDVYGHLFVSFNTKTSDCISGS